MLLANVGFWFFSVRKIKNSHLYAFADISKYFYEKKTNYEGQIVFPCMQI